MVMALLTPLSEPKLSAPPKLVLDLTYTSSIPLPKPNKYEIQDTVTE
jgi:hypothetical protein